MKEMSSLEIRETFLKYFEKADHLRIPGSSLLPSNDPTLLFINSGMAPLKQYFLGKDTPPAPRLCNIQPCIRTKDIDDVGDRHHLTLFEMLGSWSIGDYYKERAVELAFHLLVDHFGFPVEKLFVSVYEGDKQLGLPPDEISAHAWEKIGIASNRIVHLGIDNFWGPAGTTGPCGPCTEVFYDTGADYGEPYQPGGEFDTQNRYIEIWNAGVFMEYNKQKDGSFIQLPLKSVDTGSGLERMSMVINNQPTVYGIDLMKPILDAARETFPAKQYGEKEYRIFTDHLKASTMIISEGVIPSNEGQGYIPRRLLRKCIALAVSAGLKPDFAPVIEQVIHTMAEGYPHLTKNKDQILQQVRQETTEFEPVIKNGLDLLDETLRNSPSQHVSGQEVFDLVTTHGVPLEIIKGHLDKKSICFSQDDYHDLFKQHQAISRQGRKSTADMSTDQQLDPTLLETLPATEFLGYQHLEVMTSVSLLLKDGAQQKQVAQGDFILVTPQTSFYAESGGQVGDLGTGQNATGRFKIVSTSKTGQVVLHKCHLDSGSIAVDQQIQLNVDGKKRAQIQRNHSATHLLHSALMTVLGKHATQKGSLVEEKRLRFDYKHTQALLPEEIDKIELLVNQWIWENIPHDIKTTTYDEALAMGAMALFGETYKNDVRVVKFGDSSVELCGGTHVSGTGEIGSFYITSETSIARGIRRIEAVTGEKAYRLFQENRLHLKSITDSLKTTPEQIISRIEALKLQARNANKPAAVASNSTTDLIHQTLHNLTDSVRLLIGEAHPHSAKLKEMAENLLNKKTAEIVCLYINNGDAINVTVFVDKNLSKSLNANVIISKLLHYIDGKGGGKPNFAQGGGKKVEGLAALLANAQADILQLVRKLS